MLYVIRKFENGGILCSDKKPSVVSSGLFKGISKLDGKRFQIASLSRMVSQQLNDSELTEYAQQYVDSLKIGDALPWANPGDEPVTLTIDGDRVTLTRKWAAVDINKAFSAVQSFVEENLTEEEVVEEDEA